ncbi:MAG TPA: helix-turn-helix domain-containing protein [Sphingobium sp.]|nr:helix-turn-helix domain-containing protein [Sphingobium sp.]
MVTSPQSPAASPLFLREEEIRRGIELLHFGHAALTDAADAILARHELGRAHQRALYFIGRQPNMSVSALLQLLGITKQSLGRVLDELTARNLVETAPGTRDRRQRLLRLTATGETIESALFDAVRERMARAYSAAGQGSVTGFWRVLESLLDAEDQRLVAALQIPQHR